MLTQKEKAEAEEFLEPIKEIKIRFLEQRDIISQQEVRYVKLFENLTAHHLTLPLGLRRCNLFRTENLIQESVERLEIIDSLLQLEVSNLRGMEECTLAIPSKFQVSCRAMIGECCQLNLEVSQIIARILAAADDTVSKLQVV
jgi:hypothetical protein